MTASVRKHLGVRSALSVILTLASYFFYVAVAVASQRNLEVIHLSSTSTADEASKARAAFTKGDAIVLMIGGSPADFERLVGARVVDVNAFSDKGQRPNAGARTQFNVQAVAAYIDGKGIVRSMLSFAKDAEASRKQMDEWVAREQSKAAGASVEDDPSPPADAWTLLYSTTLAVSGDPGSMQSTDYVYRLNTKSPTNDYYMVYTVPQTTPDFTTRLVPAASDCDGISYCGWHTVERDFSISATSENGVAALIDHGPTGTITSTDASFHIGAGLTPEGPGADAGFSVGWSQESVTTVDHSNSQTGTWKETFSFGFGADPCIPTAVFLPLPPVSSGTFLSRQGAIFQVPGGTSSVTPSITQQSVACLYVGPLWDYNGGNGQGAYYDKLTIQASFPLGPPVLKAHPNSLTIPAKGTAPLTVAAYIPGSDEGLSWTITSNLPNTLHVPSPGPFSTGQVIPVTVAEGTPDGTPGLTLSINTSPPYAAPSVTTGPILVNVTVGPSKASPSAGILLFGGDPAPDAAEFFDLAGEVALPVTPNLPRPENSTATLLNTGNILIAGGMTEVQHAPNQPVPVTATAELFNPSSLTFSYTGHLATARAAHTATLLPDGKVLIAGGVDANANPLTSVELYDPATGTFSSAGNLTNARSYHYASVTSGPDKPAEVLIYGGYTPNGVADAGAELWHEADNSIYGGANMVAPAQNIPQPVAVADGALDLVGGYNGTEITAQEQLLNLNGPSFGVSQFELNDPRDFHTLTALPNGAGLLVTGGTNGGTPLASAEIRAATGWSLVSGTGTCPGSPGCMLARRFGHTATLLPDGTVLLVGGGSDAAESYDPASKTFTPAPSIRNRSFHTATMVVTTVTSLIATPSPSTFGQTVNLAASVTSAVGTPTGPLHFLDGSTELGSAELAQGQASIDVTNLSVGSHLLKAVYAGDAISSGSESPVITQTVGGTTTTTSLALSPNPSQFGSTVTMTATVTAASGTATGAVVFSDGGKQIASADLANGSATAQANGLSIGQHSITATYNGNGDTQGSTSAAVTQTVTAVKSSTTTTLSSSNNPSTSGQSVTFQAQVKPVSGTGAPTGMVSFLEGSTVLGTANLVSGTASFNTSTLAIGTHAIVGAYLGDNNFSASTSSVLTQTVSSGGGKVTPTVDLTVNGSTSATVTAGNTVTFVARIHAAPGDPWPTGSITISLSTDGNMRYGSADITKDPNSNDGLATITNSGIGAGSYALVATYGGDNEAKYYNGARSNTVSLTIKPSLGGPPPVRSLAISAAAGARDGALMPVSLTVTNSGTVPASGITLNQIALDTLEVTGQALLFAPSLPVTLGKLPPGASTVLTLEVKVPTTAQKLRLNESGTFKDAGGKVYQFSVGQVVFP